MAKVKRTFSLGDKRQCTIIADENGFWLGFWRPLNEGEKYPKHPKNSKKPAGTYLYEGGALSHIKLSTDMTQGVVLTLLAMFKEIEDNLKGGLNHPPSSD